MNTTLKYNSAEWRIFLRVLLKSKQKSNRDVLCLDCWQVLTYYQNLAHKRDQPSHSCHILTSNSFATERRFMKWAQKYQKVYQSEGGIFYANPFSDFEKRWKALTKGPKKPQQQQEPIEEEKEDLEINSGMGDHEYTESNLEDRERSQITCHQEVKESIIDLQNKLQVLEFKLEQQ